MKKHMMTTVAATAAVAAMALGSAAPAMATKSGLVATPGSDDMSWVMPDLDGVVLKHAIITVEHVTAPVVVNIGTVTMGHQPVINQEDWVVCGQSPKAGNKISHETLKVTFAVQRPHDTECA